MSIQYWLIYVQVRNNIRSFPESKNDHPTPKKIRGTLEDTDLVIKAGSGEKRDKGFNPRFRSFTTKEPNKINLITIFWKGWGIKIEPKVSLAYIDVVITEICSEI